MNRVMCNVNKIKNAFSFVRRNGLKGFLHELYYRSVNRFYDIKYGVVTEGVVTAASLGYGDEDLVDYVPIGYRDIFSVLKQIPLKPENTTFLDYGSGKGRALVVAATIPFKHVIGVELSKELQVISSKNIDTMKYKKAFRIDCLNFDATAYSLPDDVNLIYFFNPFKGPVLGKVIDNIHASFARSRREVYIIFFNSIHFDEAIAGKAWIKKLSQANYYPNYSCSIYKLDAGS